MRELKNTIKVAQENNQEQTKKGTKITKMKLQRPLTDRSQEKTNTLHSVIAKQEVFQNDYNKIRKSHLKE